MGDTGLLSDVAALWHLGVLAVVQGITEFLPISSSAHLILTPRLIGWQDQGLGLDVAMHIGTLAAVLLYFRRDVIDLGVGAGELLRRRRTARARLAGQIIVATLPVVVAGALLQEIIADEFRNVALIAFTTAAFGLLLWWADRRADGAKGTIASLDWRMALLIGVVQAVALIPGVSRSGITMTAALFLGLNRSEGARFSLLLSIPTTAAAGALATMNLVQTGNDTVFVEAIIGGFLAFGCALLAIAALMRWLKHATFTPFVLYRLGLSGLLAVLLAKGMI